MRVYQEKWFIGNSKSGIILTKFKSDVASQIEIMLLLVATIIITILFCIWIINSRCWGGSLVELFHGLSVLRMQNWLCLFQSDCSNFSWIFSFVSANWNGWRTEKCFMLQNLTPEDFDNTTSSIFEMFPLPQTPNLLFCRRNVVSFKRKNDLCTHRNTMKDFHK